MLTKEYEAVAVHARPKGAMWRHLSKYAPIFLLLALSGLIFLLRNIYTLENLSCHTVFTLSHVQNSIHTALAQKGPFPPYLNHTFCSQLGLQPTPDEALEDRYLLDSIAWPQLPTHLSTPPLSQTSDPVHSLFSILPSNGRREWHVGDQLEALVQMHDFQGRPKRHGGDFLIARLHSPELGAGVAGQVVDHLNGFYSALFPLLWAGEAQVNVTMVHSSEAVAVLQRLREHYPDRVYFQSLFRSGSVSQTTLCNMCLPPGPQPLCNYTDPHSGEPWYCVKPKLLGCDTRFNHARAGHLKHLISNKEALLLQRRVNIKVAIRASGPNRITVLPKEIGWPESENGSIKPETVKFVPSGYYYQGSWRSLGGGTPIRQFNDSSSITECLAGKTVYMYGDSTVRQWFDYLTAFVPDIKKFNLHSPIKVGPYMAVDSKNNILLRYRCHGPPIGFNFISSSQLRYVANELDGLAGGPNSVVFLSIWCHFNTYPVEVYIRRMRHIRRALVRLLDRAPGTVVVIRSANLQTLDKEESLYNSEWFSMQLDRVLRPMFKGLGVVFVDAWEMTLAHHLPHNLHPLPAIIKNMIDLILSHVCPTKKKG